MKVIKFTDELKRMFGLEVPVDVSNEQLKRWSLHRYYVCYSCNKPVSIWHVRKLPDIYGDRCVCPKCVKSILPIDEDAYTVNNPW